MADDSQESTPYTPLIRPGAYFRRLDRPSLGIGAGLVIASTLATGVVLWLFIRELIANVDTGSVDTSDIQSELLGQLVPFVILAFVGWFIIAVVLHAFVWFADGNRGFVTTLAVVGEAEFVALLSIPLTGLVLLQLAGQAPSEPWAAIEFLREAINNDTPMLLLIGLGATVWRAIISGVALAVVHGIPKSKAYTATFLVGILGFLLGLAA